MKLGTTLASAIAAVLTATRVSADLPGHEDDHSHSGGDHHAG